MGMGKVFDEAETLRCRVESDRIGGEKRWRERNGEKEEVTVQVGERKRKGKESKRKRKK